MNKDGQPFIGASTRKRIAAEKKKVHGRTYQVPARVGPFVPRKEERQYKRMLRAGIK